MNRFLRSFLCFHLLLVSSASVSTSAVVSPQSKKLIKIRGGRSGEELKKFDWRFFVAGGICAACSHGITTPIG
jgi:hypothetical protein